MYGSGTCANLTAKIFQSERPSLFYVPQINERRHKEARKGVSHGSLHRHQVLLEPRHSFTSPKSWTPWDWQSPLNWAPSDVSVCFCHCTILFTISFLVVTEIVHFDPNEKESQKIAVIGRTSCQSLQFFETPFHLDQNGQFLSQPKMKL